MITGKELAQKVLDHVEAHPDQHDQSIWIDNPTPGATSLCNTTACLAGWAVLLNRRENEPPHRTLVRLAVETGAHEEWEEVAAKLLLGDEYVDRYDPSSNPPARQLDLYRVFYTSTYEAVEKFAEVFGLDVDEA